MITVPAQVMAAANTTHAPLWRVRMLTAAGAQIGEPLPFTDGTITKAVSMVPRCTATLTVPTGAVPALIDQNYLPTGQRLLFEYAVQGIGAWITVADLDLIESEITRPDSLWTMTAVDRSVRVGLDDTARGSWVEPTGTIQAAIQYIVNRTFPGTVFSITGPATTMTVPTGAETDGDPWSAAIGLATIAKSELFFRAHDRVCVVRRIPVLAASGVDSIAVAVNLTQYTLLHSMSFNTVVLQYLDKTGGALLRTGVWTDTRTTSPVAVQRVGSHVVYRETRRTNAAPSKVDADAAAESLATRAAGHARSPSIRHVARPWLEPGDTIAVTYVGGPTELQLVDSIDIPLDNSNIQTTTARSSDYQMGVPV